MLQQDSPNRIAFAEIEASAVQPHDIAALAKTLGFRQSIQDVSSAETDQLIRELDRIINSPDQMRSPLFSLKEIENTIYQQHIDEMLHEQFLVMTDRYLKNPLQKRRIDRLLQIANNKKIKTRIIESETPAGKRVTQFGGIALFGTRTKQEKLR